MSPFDWPAFYAGMTYEDASKQAAYLIKRASNGDWFDLPERLTALRTVMLKRIRENTVP